MDKENKDMAPAYGTGPSQAEPEVSALRASVPGAGEETVYRYDDRVKPMLFAQAETRGASNWNYEDAEQVIAALLERIDALEASDMEGKLEEARDILSGLSSYLGAGLGDDKTTLKQFDGRIRWGIDYIGSVYRNRAAQVVEECSKDRKATWGTVKRAILDDTALPVAQGMSAGTAKTAQPVEGEARQPGSQSECATPLSQPSAPSQEQSK